eukprot:CAMPEP_0197523388 /NCGR_PEP_ID=MMETSP1318-20131121/8328_1 /TAXON_ID=552666 /ORGANISM="Partenskyella glossopodia, Strain RCC365" /LENGTH=334 /DNA_ID=CAMNT_0043076063 /DNA_START=118 /DNA_END=1122 /DNA_ORIENTATION=+
MSNIDELQEVVAKALEAKGVLSKLRAELRKHVFDVMEEQERSDGEPGSTSSSSAKTSTMLESKDGKLVAAMLVDFLQCCQLDHTLSVFRSEANIKSSELMSKDETASVLGVTCGPDEAVLMRFVAQDPKSPKSPVTTSSNSEKKRKEESKECMLKTTMSSTQLKSALSAAATIRNVSEESPPAASASIVAAKTIEEGKLMPKPKPKPLAALPSISNKSKLGALPTLKPIGVKALAPLKATTTTSTNFSTGEVAAAPVAAASESKNNDYDDFDDDIGDDIGDDIEIDDDADWDADNYDQDDAEDYVGDDPYSEDKIVENEQQVLSHYDYVESVHS